MHEWRVNVLTSPLPHANTHPCGESSRLVTGVPYLKFFMHSDQQQNWPQLTPSPQCLLQNFASPSRGVSIAEKLLGALVSVLLHFTEKLILSGGQIIFVFFPFFMHSDSILSPGQFL